MQHTNKPEAYNNCNAEFSSKTCHSEHSEESQQTKTINQQNAKQKQPKSVILNLIQNLKNLSF
jgi:hypothetical protein